MSDIRLNMLYAGSNFVGFSESELLNAGVPQDEIDAAKDLVVLSNREKSYAAESDKLFLEALRKDAAGDIEGAEEARAAALVAVEAIKERFPLPTE
ncbi:hypothetical protein [Marinomonas sp. ef1]|uniref:hypothetical protein n=1 Tax=Marinomonas sp. ef1 TaxID=2005043 RepID=UPI000C2956CA|nr:hypothetical protein [Marinomonas sp. ef1]